MEDTRRLRLTELCQKIGYQFKDLELLSQALRHSSYVHEHPGEAAASYERLEYLGDAVLELVISQILYESFPAASEGELSKARSSVVNEARLAVAARRLELGAYLLLGRGEQNQGGRDKPSLLADAVEAIAAAVYLDGGLEPARRVLLGLLGEAARASLEKTPHKDPKTRLQELVQEALHITPQYQLSGSSGPDHAKTFTVTLFIADKEVATGSGNSKKEAEQNAARRGLELWDSLELN